MTDHVPGPWYSKKTSVVSFEGTRRIQIATTRQPIFTPDAQAANARLIAAAPDLLAALDKLLTLNRTQGVTQEEYEAAEEEAEAAWSKATGQTD